MPLNLLSFILVQKPTDPFFKIAIVFHSFFLKMTCSGWAIIISTFYASFTSVLSVKFWKKGIKLNIFLCDSLRKSDFKEPGKLSIKFLSSSKLNFFLMIDASRI